MSQDPPLISPISPSSSTISIHSPLSQKPASLSSADSHDSARYRGVRKRKWGKWVAEIRVPHSRVSRIWLGSYASPQAAAAAFDVATYCLRGPSARMNLPHLLPSSLTTLSCTQLSPKSVQKLALAAGSVVDHSTGAPLSDRADAQSFCGTHSAASSTNSRSTTVGTRQERLSFPKPPRLSIAPAPAALSNYNSDVAQAHWKICAKLAVSPMPTIAQLADAMLLAPPSLNEERSDEEHVAAAYLYESSLWQF